MAPNPDPLVPLEQLGTIELVSGMVDDARELVGAHVEALREDLATRVAGLGAAMGTMLIAIGVFVVTAILLDLAIATTLVALGLPWWLAMWLVTLVTAGIGTRFLLRARAKARAMPTLP
ncbi:MAG: hypothetical protein NT062_25430 [Proteobacteria bacterium]|nr:hypothetical protein [Pseudomonadota bacterium]